MNLNKLNAKITESGKSKKNIAKEFDISVQALNKKLKGNTKITVDDALKFCDILPIVGCNEKCEIFLQQPSQK